MKLTRHVLLVGDIKDAQISWTMFGRSTTVSSAPTAGNIYVSPMLHRWRQ